MSIATAAQVGYGHAEYERLVSDVAELKALPTRGQRDLRPLAEDFLFAEAELLDSSRFEDWLALFTADGAYWVAADTDVRDPRTHTGLAFDDRRRLDDRVYWLRTGLAYCQIPESRTRHVIGNVVARRGDEPGTLLVRSNFVLTENRADMTRAFSGWYGHVLTHDPGADVSSAPLAIRSKVVCLVEADAGHRNLTLIF